MADNPTVEMFLNGEWTDVTSYVYDSDKIAIKRGQSGEGARTETSSCRMTLNNRDGRWSPRNPAGPYYGQLTRNVPIRVSIEAGESYLRLLGETGELVSTPDHSDLDITGDIDIRVELSMDDWVTTSDDAELIAKYRTTSNQRSWLVYLAGNNQIAYRWSADGVNFTSEFSSQVYLPIHTRCAVRVVHDVNNGAGGNTVYFYTADSINGPWTLVSSETNTGTTSIFSSTAPIEIGDFPSLAADLSPGRIYKAEVRNGINGTVVTNPDFTTQTPGATSFADSTGKTWTLSGAASISNRKTRFVGEVSSLSIDGDLTGKDARVQLEAAGIMRRISQGTSPLDSALRRFIKVNEPIECWPLTDGPQAIVGKSLVGGQDMGQVIGADDTAASFGEGALGPGIEPVVSIPPDATGSLAGTVPNSTAAASTWSVDFFITGGGNESAGGVIINDRGAGTDADNQVEIFMSFNGNGDNLTTTWASRGDTASSSGLVTVGSNTFIYDTQPHHVRFTMDPSGSSTNWELYVDGELHDSGSIGIVVKAVKNIQVGWGYLTLANEIMTSRSLGYVTYWDGNGPTAAEMWDAMNGFTGERAADRIERILEEEGIPYQRLGTDTGTPQMGIQIQDQMLDILRECEAVDLGFLYEPREFLGLTYRDQQSLYNQDPRLTIDYAQHQLSKALLPVEDDQTIRNDITAKQKYGSQYRVTLDEGTLSTQAPPNGVGRYDDSIDVNLYDPDDLTDYAHWKLHLGTVDEARYPQISLNLRHTTFADDVHKMEEALRLDLGDRVVIKNPPSWLPPDDIELLAIGFQEEYGAKERDIIVNCVPASPYNIAITDASRVRADTDGTSLTSAIDADDTTISLTTQTDSALWTTEVTDLPFDLNLGGEVVEVVHGGTVLNANTDFESGTTGWNASNGTLTQSSDYSRTGTYSGLLTTGTGSNPRAADTYRAVTAGNTYIATGWLYTPVRVPHGVGINVNWADSTQTYLSTSSNTAEITPGVWTPFTAEFTAPVSAEYASVLFTVSGTPGAGHKLYADNVKLIEDATGITDSVSDAFTRTVASGWGTADIGGTWATSGGSAADYSTSGTYGAVAHASLDIARITTLTAPSADVDLYVDVATNALASGAAIYGGPCARLNGNTDWYMARVQFSTTQAIRLTIRKRVSSTETELAGADTSLTHVAGTFYRVRFQAVGSTLRAKIWNPALSSEPGVWTVSTTDTSHTAANNVGTRAFASAGNTTVSPATWYDNFRIVNPQTLNVVRSVNGITKSHTAGTAARLAQPFYVGR